MPRYFKSISEKELVIKIGIQKRKCCDGVNEEWDDYLWKELTPQINKDLSKVDFDFENIATNPTESTWGPSGLVGYHTLSNGLSFKGMAAGGDWENPVFFIIYWDGKKLRAYVPTEGNPWNTDTKMAYGNDPYDVTDGINVIKRYPSKFNNMDPKSAEQNMYRLKVGFEPDKIITDISNRIKRKT